MNEKLGCLFYGVVVPFILIWLFIKWFNSKTGQCPYCMAVTNKFATKCPQCTKDL